MFLTMSDQNLLIQMSRDLATNTEATKNIEKHLAQLNSKVALQEANQISLKAASDLHAKAIDTMLDNERMKKERRSRLNWLTIENIFKFVFGVALTYLLYKAGI